MYYTLKMLMLFVEVQMRFKYFQMQNNLFIPYHLTTILPKKLIHNPENLLFKVMISMNKQRNLVF